MVAPIIAFAAGVWWLQQQAVLPPLDRAWVLAALALCGLLLPDGGVWRRRLRRGILLAGCAGAGFLWAAAQAQWRLADALPAAWEGRDITVIGVVARLPQRHDRGVRFALDVEQVLTPGAVLPSRVVLSWWSGAARDGGPAPPPELAPGERWQLVIRLKRPHGFANPHGFDYEAWLLENGIRATGSVRPRSAPLRLAEQVAAPAYWIEAQRGRMRSRIAAALGEAPAAGVIAALAMGDQGSIPPAQWQVYTRTGVNHLMSISGLHVTLLSGLVFGLVNAAWRRSARLTLVLPAVKAAALAGLATAVAYALLAGFAVPAQRTVYMLAVVALALWTGRMAAAANVLAGALCLVLLLDPWAVLAPGFWLSFGAVAVIMAVSAQRLGPVHWLAGWARVQWAVTLALVPLLLALFQQVSVISPLANAIAIPVVSLVVVPLALLGVVLPFDGVLQLAHAVMALCLAGLEVLSALPAAAWEQQAPPAWTVIVALAGAAWLLLPRGFPARWVGACAFLPLFLVAPAPPVEQGLRLTVLDVGQGLAVVAQTRHHALLFDTGPAFGTTADSGSRIILPYLRASGIRRLDVLVVSHDDADHTGGAVSVLQAMPVEQVLTSLPDLDPLVLLSRDEQRCAAGQAWTWDGVHFALLHPAAADYAVPRIRDNDRSCVLKITAPGGSVLIPADIERRGEQSLLAAVPEQLRSTVLIAPHQGSRTSSAPAFVAAAAPRYVVFPVGYRNPFGHPHPEVVARYEGLGSTVVRTDRDGAALFEFVPGAAPVLTLQRARYRRYWLDPHAAAALPGDGTVWAW